MPFRAGWENVSNSEIKRPLICVLLLNWNGWKDTIECLESVYRLERVDFRVVVCDNDSQDGSLDRIQDWANGKLIASPTNSALEQFTSPPIPKPIATRRFDGWQAAVHANTTNDDVLTLIQTGANLGFAGGNNCGLRYCLAVSGFDYVWLLNNDTVASPDALAVMLEAMQADPSLGIVGSQLRDYLHPDRVQVQGGKFYSVWSARVRANLEQHPARPVDYLDGASLLVSRAFLSQAGLMDERYFLYFEELDWSLAAKRSGFRQTFVPESVIFHKEGASSGTNQNAALRGLTSERFLVRNRIFFTRRYHTWATPTVTLWILLTAIRAAVRRDWKRVGVILKAIVEGYRANAR